MFWLFVFCACALKYSIKCLSFSYMYIWLSFLCKSYMDLYLSHLWQHNNVLNVILKPTSCDRTTKTGHRKECKTEDKKVSIHYLSENDCLNACRSHCRKTWQFHTVFFILFLWYFFSLSFPVLIVMEPWNHVYFLDKRKR